MRRAVHCILFALLIVAGAIGGSLSVQAGCLECEVCSSGAPADAPAPCEQDGLACPSAQSCFSQPQKFTASPLAPLADGTTASVYAPSIAWAAASALVIPDTAPPRL